jgi:hypothetical protein
MRKVLLILTLAAIVAPTWAAEIYAGDLAPVTHLALGQPATNPQTRALIPAYSNVTTYLGNAYAPGGAAGGITKLVADDITPVGYGGMEVWQVKFSVANLNTSTVSARARIRFWYADGAGGAPGTYYASPANVGYTFNALAFAPGVTVVTGTLGNETTPSAFLLPTGTFWAGLTFDNNAGATGATDAQLSNFGQGIFNPPTLGTSADQLFATTSPGSFFGTANPAGSVLNFSGSPVANLGWEFSVPEPASGLLLAVALLMRRR